MDDLEFRGTTILGNLQFSGKFSSSSISVLAAEKAWCLIDRHGLRTARFSEMKREAMTSSPGKFNTHDGFVLMETPVRSYTLGDLRPMRC